MIIKDLEIPARDGVGCRVVWRSMFLETLWHHDKKQNVGFVFALMPVLKRLYPGEPERKQAVIRHLEPANTHPAMSPLAIGVTIRLEQRFGPSTIAYRNRLMETLAAVGDRVFWSHLRTLAAVVATLGCLCFFGSFVACLALVVVYNVPHLLVRTVGLREGLRMGLEVFRVVTVPRAEIGCVAIRRTIALGLGCVSAMLVLAAIQRPVIAEGYVAKAGVAACLGAFGVIAYVLKRASVPLARIVYVSVVASLILFLLLGV
jgi:mannose/fructose/N-acetylgalactosamine-specific phosphotransferase system component IID